MSEPTAEERAAFKRSELHRSHWCEECAREAAVKEKQRIATAVEALPIHYRRNGCATPTAWVTRRHVIAAIDEEPK